MKIDPRLELGSEWKTKDGHVCTLLGVFLNQNAKAITVSVSYSNTTLANKETQPPQQMFDFNFLKNFERVVEVPQAPTVAAPLDPNANPIVEWALACPKEPSNASNVRTWVDLETFRALRLALEPLNLWQPWPWKEGNWYLFPPPFKQMHQLYDYDTCTIEFAIDNDRLHTFEVHPTSRSTDWVSAGCRWPGLPVPAFVDRSNQCTTSGEAPADVRAAQLADPETGQHKSYITLCESERAKGFVRPVRTKYIHVGVGGHEIDPNNPAKHGRTGDGCGVETRMATSIAETFARDPGFYSAGFCCGCNRHVPNAELVWEDGTVVGS